MGEYKLAEARMIVIWLGALFVLGGLLFMVAQPIWRGRLSDARRTSSAVPRKGAHPLREPHTLEPRRAWCRVWTESELAWPRTYRARWHSLNSGGWPVAVAEIAPQFSRSVPPTAPYALQDGRINRNCSVDGGEVDVDERQHDDEQRLAHPPKMRREYSSTRESAAAS